MPTKQNYDELCLKDIVRNILEEARMIIPGIQALFGFQLIAIFSDAFNNIPSMDKAIHMSALLLTIGAIGFLMAPASYHRQVEQDTVSHDFIEYSSKLLCLGMGLLMLSISLDTFVVFNMITKNLVWATITSVMCLLFFFALWYIVPLLKKNLKEERGKRNERRNA